MRSAILETALELFRALGFEHTRIREVVGRLRISEATFFNYFPTKQSVLEAAAEDLVARSRERLRAELIDNARPVRERLELLARDFAGNLSGDRQLAVLLAANTRFLLGHRDRDPEGLELFTALFAEGQQRGELRTDVAPQVLSEIYGATMLCAINSWLDDIDSGSLEDRLLATVSVFWRGAHDGPSTSTRPRSGRGTGRVAARR